MDKAVDILNEYATLSDIYVKYFYLRDTYYRNNPNPNITFDEFIAQRSVEFD